MISSRQIDPDALPEGTYLNSGEAARRGLKINRFCYDLRRPENRAAFEADAEACMERYALDPEDRALIRQKDWLGLIKRGANVFVLLRLAQLCGDGLIATGAQMRGETVEQYLATRKLGKGG
jgi:protocatechuate 4,5-dioxygenase alpha subunit